MTSAALPLSRGAPGTQPREVEERADDALRLLGSELPRRGTSEDVPNREKGRGVWKGDCRPQKPCRHFFFFFFLHHPPPAGNGLSRVSLPGTRSGNQHGRQVIGLKWCLFFRGWGHRQRWGGTGESLPFSPAPRSWTASGETQNRRHRPPHQSRTGPRTTALAKARALLLLFFFISLFHIHISHSMEKPERVRQRWYNRSAVTGAGRGGAEREHTGWLPTCIPLGH